MSQEQIYCIYCGKANFIEARFCHYCGKPMPDDTQTAEKAIDPPSVQASCPYCENQMLIEESVTSLICSSCAASMAIKRENGSVSFYVQQFHEYQ